MKGHSETMWAVLTPVNKFALDHLSWSEESVISDMIEKAHWTKHNHLEKHDWEFWTDQGYRAVKVKVEVIDE